MILKRAFDIVVSGLGLLLLSPLLLAVMLGIWLQDRQSPFYIPVRAAAGGGTFRMVKFRSMVANADKLGGSSTATTDRRITPVGRFVRRYKLDELIQLWNVFRGDMSLVGPRPQVLSDAALYTDAEKRMLTVRPGITDIASIVFSDEGEILAGSPDPDRLYDQIIRPWKSRLALAWIDHRTLGVDLWLIFVTIVAIVSRPHALRLVQRLLGGWQLEPLTIRMAARNEPLMPYPPPTGDAAAGRRSPAPVENVLNALARLSLSLADWFGGRFLLVARLLTLAGIFALSAVCAFLLRFEFRIGVHFHEMLLGLAVWIPLKLLVFRLFGLHRGWWRLFSTHDLMRLAWANLAGSLLSAATIYSCGFVGYPRSIYILDLLLCLMATTGVRVALRILADLPEGQVVNASAKRVFIYGAGNAGIALLREIRSARLPYAVCGFIDDNPHKLGLNVQGMKILGSGSALPGLVVRHRVSEALLAVPSATGPQLTAILNLCLAGHIKCRMVPALAQILEGTQLASQIRDVAVEDLLGRAPARLEHDHIRARLSGEAVLVTGAAGSIGSELCRQIAQFAPRVIVGFDIAESALFQIEGEMRQSFPQVAFHAEIGSIQNATRLAEVLMLHSPSVLYHAAAYKHVPMMEAHVFEAIENNVFGTCNVAVEAARHGVKEFVMISSDKAVRPTNVMGATKRVAELIILSQQRTGTSFVAVRFGNVLGSNGSVIPIFKQQIAAGGPVTVTDPEMRRYFMTIPEAAQLVLQASTMGRGGEIFVLDMGEPVKIADLARDLILLSGLRPNEDIAIKFTGPRPGEKLYEELNLHDENILPTHHEKIRILSGNGVSPAIMNEHLERFRGICRRRDLPALLLILKELIPDYNPSSYLLQRALRPERQNQPDYSDSAARA